MPANPNFQICCTCMFSSSLLPPSFSFSFLFCCLVEEEEDENGTTARTTKRQTRWVWKRRHASGEESSMEWYSNYESFHHMIVKRATALMFWIRGCSIVRVVEVCNVDGWRSTRRILRCTSTTTVSLKNKLKQITDTHAKLINESMNQWIFSSHAYILISLPSFYYLLMLLNHIFSYSHSNTTTPSKWEYWNFKIK